MFGDAVHGVPRCISSLNEFAVVWWKPLQAVIQRDRTPLQLFGLSSQFLRDGLKKGLAKNKSVALLAFAGSSHLVLGDPVRPRSKIRPELERIKFAPKYDVGFLKQIVGVTTARHAAL